MRRLVFLAREGPVGLILADWDEDDKRFSRYLAGVMNQEGLLGGCSLRGLIPAVGVTQMTVTKATRPSEMRGCWKAMGMAMR